MIASKNTVKGNITTVKSGIIVHGCNAQGVMGSGVALAIKQKWPKAFNDYATDYKNGNLKLGFVSFVTINDDLIIANAITQERYGRSNQRYVSYDAIRSTFTKIANMAKIMKMDIHYPKIGAGLGGGDWNIISTIIDQELDGLTHTLWDY